MPLRTACLVVLLCAFCGSAYAQASGPDVTAGSADFETSGNDFTITTSDRAIIEWQRFGVAPGSRMVFVQPSCTSSVLNRVVGTDISRIDGVLTANGRLYLINPNGIIVGPGGIIHAAGLVASTLDILDEEFLAQKDLNLVGSSGAAVVNLGTIETPCGSVCIVAEHVRNEGTIAAVEGSVTLVAADSVLLTQDGKVFIRSSSATAEGTGVENSGVIEAAQAELLAHGSLYEMAINNSGIINATGCRTVDGRVILFAEGGDIVNTGTLSATTAILEGAKGGTIQVLGGRLRLEGGGLVDASGELGGGAINIGGSFQGQGPLPNAESVSVGESVRIAADGTRDGNGGTVILWADGVMEFLGSVSAEAQGTGDGGFIEVSGKDALTFGGIASTLAVNGATGTLLLDPTNITISDAANGNVTGASPYEPTGAGSNLNTTTLTTALAANNVVVQTAAAGAEEGDITVSGEVSWNSAFSLELKAHDDIFVHSSIQNAGSGAVTLRADSDSSGAGSVYINRIDAPDFAWVDVGSKTGKTMIFGNNLILQAGTGNNSRAHVGFLGAGTGDIEITLSGNLELRGSVAASPNTAGWRYAQIGHGGAATGGDISGNIVIVLTSPSSDVIVEAGRWDGATLPAPSGGFHAQIGHSSADVGTSTVAGNISIAGGSNLSLTGGGAKTDQAYALIGHGAYRRDGSYSGSIDLDFSGDVQLRGGDFNWTFAQIGHCTGDGEGMRGAPTDTIRITAGGSIILTAVGGGGDQAGATYAQIGNGGRACRTANGNIVLTIGRDLVLTGGEGHSNCYAQVGNGGEGYLSNISGDVTITFTSADSDLSMTGGAFGQSNYALVGLGGVLTMGRADPTTPAVLSGNITITGGRNLTMIGGSGSYASAQVGHGGVKTLPVSDQYIGDIDLTFSGMLHMQGGSGQYAYAQIGHAGDYEGLSTASGDINLEFSEINFIPGTGIFASGLIGHGDVSELNSDFIVRVSDVSGSLFESTDPDDPPLDCRDKGKGPKGRGVGRRVSPAETAGVSQET
ncbi:MAG: two-partner secretion domain-containing protein [Planctomycetota bacterium]